MFNIFWCKRLSITLLQVAICLRHKYWSRRNVRYFFHSWLLYAWRFFCHEKFLHSFRPWRQERSPLPSVFFLSHGLIACSSSSSKAGWVSHSMHQSFQLAVLLLIATACQQHTKGRQLESKWVLNESKWLAIEGERVGDWGMRILIRLLLAARSMLSKDGKKDCWVFNIVTAE